MFSPDFAAHVPAECGFSVTAWMLPPPAAARRARSLLRSHVARHIRDPDVLDDLVLMVCELGTNAAIHAEGPYEMRILHYRGVPVVCEIADTGGGLDEIARHLRRPRDSTEVLGIDALRLGGRGLGVVAHLSEGRCGVHITRLCTSDRPGKGVWFAIPVAGSADCDREGATEDFGPVPGDLQVAAAEVFFGVTSAAGARRGGDASGVLEEPSVVGEQRDLDAVVEVELGQDAGDAGLRGRHAEVERHADLGVGPR